MRIRLLPYQLNDAASRRAPGYLAAFKAAAEILPSHIDIERDALELLNREWPVIHARPLAAGEALPETTPRPRPAVSAEVWPMNTFGIAARALRLMKTPADQGVGDTIARVIGPIGGDAYKAWFLETFGRSCGCAERQADLNQKFPYPTPK